MILRKGDMMVSFKLLFNILIICHLFIEFSQASFHPVDDDTAKAFLKSPSSDHKKEDLILKGLDRERFKISKPFITSTPIFLSDERAWPGNLTDLKERTSTEFREDGLVYQNKEILDSEEMGLWVLSSQGELCVFFPLKHPNIISAVHHTFFFKEEGIGQAIACGGHIEVRKGKIISLSNDSGRYQPINLQLILSVKYLHHKNVLDPNISVKTYAEEDTQISLKEALTIADSLGLNG